MKKIAMLCGDITQGSCGIADYSNRLCIAMRSLGHEVVFFGENRTGATIGPHDSQQRWALSFKNAWRAWRAIKSFKPDEVHVQLPCTDIKHRPLLYLLPFLLKISGLKIALTIHEGSFLGTNINNRFIAFLLWNCMDKILSVRPDIREIAVRESKKLGRLFAARPVLHLPATATLIPGNISHFQQIQFREALLSPHDSRRILVFFGFLYPLREPELLLSIAEPQTDVVIFCGGTPNQETETHLAHLKTMSNQNNWSGKVHFYPNASHQEISTILLSADAAVFTAHNTGPWNTSLLASLAHNTPAVVLRPSSYIQTSPLVFCAQNESIEDAQACLSKLPAWVPKNILDVDQQWSQLAQKHFTDEA